MFAGRIYKTAAVVLGAGSCALYALNRNNGIVRGETVLKAATSDNGSLGDNFSFTSKPWDNNWDKRERPAGAEKSPKPTATRHIILIRHGQYNLNGATDVEQSLTEIGLEQARLTGLRLGELKLGVDKIYKSTMTRATETSDVIQKCFPDANVHATDLLQEGSPIDPTPSDPKWTPSPKEFFEDAPRVEAAFRKFFHRASPSQDKNSVELLICHANVIRYFVCRALQFAPEGWGRIALQHCSITWIEVRPNGKVLLRCVGDSGHLPPDKLTFR